MPRNVRSRQPDPAGPGPSGYARGPRPGTNQKADNLCATKPDISICY